MYFLSHFILFVFDSHPLPSLYDLQLSIIRNISTAAVEITCDSKNRRLPPCPNGYKDGDKYVFQALSQPCRKVSYHIQPNYHAVCT